MYVTTLSLVNGLLYTHTQCCQGQYLFTNV